eukprot:TRINITY_DN2120_c0_g1::TRINITY_DN2120_c0_g1_i1::g.12914::m.12914 TRINITY_DN2120_c0_g1::TRINITY_DN2120_c0_g1_i1::g.12914  ORF type:complete len:303 (+),score=39.36,sp/Q67Z52/TBCB_ARATH/45.53/3e-74,Ubiquitin_2/PF14560.1/3.1e-30,CAP_GLY/PF01302.20/6.9e-23,ubiquitin/PF00240.18/0.0058 TRINITY_DN2120_c0_g1_i1:87-911(+)
MLPVNQDLAALKAYVQGPTSQNQAESTVRLHVTHSNLKASFLEIRLDKHLTIESVKEKLKTHTGTSVTAMKLYLKDSNGNLLCELDDDTRMLGYYSPLDGYTLHVQDTDPFSMSAHGGLEDLSLVQKYVMPDDEYNKRDNTYRKYKETMLAKDPSWTLDTEMKRRKDPNYEPKAQITDPEYGGDLAKDMKVEDRCEVYPGSRRGSIRYVGKAENLGPGYWIGVEYDEPFGKNNGTVKGVKYFECEDKFGGMVRPEHVKVGDYPPLDLDDFDDEL